MKIAAMRTARPMSPGALFFPAASVHAAIVLPWSVLGMTGVTGGTSSLSTPYGHAHEMLLGYALAVVAGFQLPAMRAWRLFAMLAVWLSARVLFVVWPGPAGFVLDAGFAGALALHAAPRLLRAAKKLRNQALPAILVALCASAIALDASRFHRLGNATSSATVVVLVLATLLLFMGGRIIAPAAAGQLYRQGLSLGARVQPKIEGALIVAMAFAVVGAAVPGLQDAMRAACAVAGTLALLRLVRWRLWACEHRPDLVCLGVGYGWLGLGLLAIAVSPGGYRTAALHVMTVGALGTLTLNVMAITTLARARRSAADASTLVACTTLIGCATLLRIAAAVPGGHREALLVAAAACWSTAFAFLCALLVTCRRARADRRMT